MIRDPAREGRSCCARSSIALGAALLALSSFMSLLYGPLLIVTAIHAPREVGQRVLTPLFLVLPANGT